MMNHDELSSLPDSVKRENFKEDENLNSYPAKEIEKKLMWQNGSMHTKIIVVSSTDQYRRLARELPLEEDSILEIGCSTGAATRCLAATGASVLAVDIAQKMIDKLKDDMKFMPNVKVLQCDGRNVDILMELMPNPNLIFIDIGGNAPLDNAAFQLRQCLRAFTPRMVVVRNFELDVISSMIYLVEYPPDRPSPLQPLDVGGEGNANLENLLDHSRSSNVYNRIFAASRLKKLDTPAARKRLIEMRNDSDHRVRRIIENVKGVEENKNTKSIE